MKHRSIRIALGLALAPTIASLGRAASPAFQIAPSPLPYPAGDPVFRRAIAVSDAGIGLVTVSHYAQGVEYTHAITFSRFNPQGTVLGGSYDVGPQPYDDDIVVRAFAGNLAVGAVPYENASVPYPVTVAARWDALTGQRHTLPMPTLPGTTTGPATTAAVQFAGKNGFVAGTANDGATTYFARWNLNTDAVQALQPLKTNQVNEIDGTPVLSGISSNGTVAGNDWLTRTDGNFRSQDKRAVIWSLGSSAPTVLAVPAYAGDESFQSSAASVNASGVVVGTIVHDKRAGYVGGRTIQRTASRVRWDGGANAPVALSVPLGALGESDPGLLRINDAGAIVGESDENIDPNANAATPYAGVRAIRWEPGQTTGTVLGNLGSNARGYGSAEPRGINSSSTIFGVSSKYDANHQYVGPRGVIWLSGQILPIELSTYLPAGYQVTDVRDLTDTGWISGDATYVQTDGTPSAPEPMIMLVPEAGTYGRGDGNFDTLVDFDDLLLLAKHYGQASTGSVDVADFDLNGTTDFNDLLTLARNYRPSTRDELASRTSASFAADWSLAQSLVPEPMLGGLAACGFSIGRRRRRA